MRTKIGTLKFSIRFLKVSGDLSSKLLCLSAKTIREWVMNYLTEEALKAGSREISIPFDRQGIADYLNVERTTFSKELSRMRNECLIIYRKNTFVLTRRDVLKSWCKN